MPAFMESETRSETKYIGFRRYHVTKVAKVNFLGEEQIG